MTRRFVLVGLSLLAAFVHGPANAETVGEWRVVQVSAEQLPEVSGCAFSRKSANRIWAHNDSGGRAEVFSVDIQSGEVGDAVELRGVKQVDIEDIAITASGSLIVADIGDNAEKRRSVQLYQFDEPTSRTTTVESRQFDLKYPDGAHNAEAFVVTPDGASALIITKKRKGVAGVYHAQLGAKPTVAMKKVGEIKIGGEFGFAPNQITGADLSGSTLVIRTYQFAYSLTLPSGGKLSEVVKATPQRIVVPLMVQAEAICISPDGKTIVTASEARGANTFIMAVGKTR